MASTGQIKVTMMAQVINSQGNLQYNVPLQFTVCGILLCVSETVKFSWIYFIMMLMMMMIIIIINCRKYIPGLFQVENLIFFLQNISGFPNMCISLCISVALSIPFRCFYVLWALCLK